MDKLYDYLKDKFNQSNFSVGSIGKHLPNDLKLELLERTSHLPKETKLSQRMYDILNPNSYHKCKNGFYKPFNTFDKGYRTFCKNNCKCMKDNQSKVISDQYEKLTEEEKLRRIDKAKQTNLKNWGETNHMKSPKFIEKYKQDNLKNHGVEFKISTKEVQDKIKDTNKKKYGVEYPFQNKDILNSALENSKESHGGEYMIKAKESYKDTIIDNDYIKVIDKDVIISIEEFIKTLNVKYEKNNRKILDKKELDFYFPDYNLALEYDSFYYHNEDHINIKSKDYHKEKTDKCEKNGVQLIHIFQDEWFSRQDSVKSKIMNLLKISSKGCGARKLLVQEISNTRSQEFLEKYHLQGKTTGVSINIGAFDVDNNLVAVMSFGKNKNYDYELKRFATDRKSYPGVASKLLSYFIKKYNPESIISFADRRWSTGKIYDTLNFTRKEIIPIDYSYIKGSKRFHKFNFRRDKLLKLLNLEDSNQTEKELSELYGLKRIWDCGKIKFILDGDNLRKYKE